MQHAGEEIPTKIETPNAVVRQLADFGDASEYGTMGAEHIRFDAGTDIAPLLEGLPGDLCDSPHWGYVLSGRLAVRYADGTEEEDAAGDLIYWPPGHTVRAVEDAEFVLFSPRDEHTAVLDHIRRKVDGTEAR